MQVIQQSNISIYLTIKQIIQLWSCSVCLSFLLHLIQQESLPKVQGRTTKCQCLATKSQQSDPNFQELVCCRVWLLLSCVFLSLCLHLMQLGYLLTFRVQLRKLSVLLLTVSSQTLTFRDWTGTATDSCYVLSACCMCSILCSQDMY